MFAVGVAFVTQHALVPILDYCANTLARKVDGALRARLVAAVARPTGIGRLGDEQVHDLVREALGVGEGHPPGGGGRRPVPQPRHLADGAQPGGDRGAVLGLARRGAVGVPRCGEVHVGQRDGSGCDPRHRCHRDLRRADYFREMSLRPEAPKEIRILGLSDWLATRYGAFWWWKAMRTVWDERAPGTVPSWLWSVPWGILVAGSFLLVALSAARGEISLAAMMVTLQAIIAATSVWISQDDIKVAYGATSVPAVLKLERITADPAGSGRAGPRRRSGFADNCRRAPVRAGQVQLPGPDHRRVAGRRSGGAGGQITGDRR